VPIRWCSNLPWHVWGFGEIIAQMEDDYKHFQDLVFQEIRDREDADSNSERRVMRFSLKMGGLLGLTEPEVRALYKDGMTWVEMLDAMRAIRRN
jgi:hypothetical protein